MIRSSSLPPRPLPSRGGTLVRADLLHAAFRALQDARALDERASQSGTGGRSAELLERLDAHREILARRAANVALAPIVTAEELHELRDTARRLVAVRGWVARKLGLVGQLS